METLHMNFFTVGLVYPRHGCRVRIKNGKSSRDVLKNPPASVVCVLRTLKQEGRTSQRPGRFTYRPSRECVVNQIISLAREGLLIKP